MAIYPKSDGDALTAAEWNQAYAAGLAETAARQAADAAIIASGAEPANVGIAPVIATGSTAIRTVADRFADVVNVKDFGATGNGVTDDTTSIQAAMDYAFGSGGRKSVFFPEGTYRITDSLKITGVVGARIWGAGKEATAVVQSTANKQCFYAATMAYSHVSHMKLTNSSGTTTVALFDLGGTASPNSQANTFEMMLFQGGGSGVAFGVRLGMDGNMGSENLFLNCHFNTLGIGIRTDNFNALQNQVVGGNFQNCEFAIDVMYGSVTNISGVGFQNFLVGYPLTQAAQGLADVRIQNAVADTCVISGCRSEGDVLVKSMNGARVAAIGNTVLSPNIGVWAAGHAYALDEVVVSSTTGNTFRCTTPGTSGGVEPTWNNAADATTTDGGAVWTSFWFSAITGDVVLGNYIAHGGIQANDYGANHVSGNVLTSSWGLDCRAGRFGTMAEGANVIRDSVYNGGVIRSRATSTPSNAAAWNPQYVGADFGNKALKFQFSDGMNVGFQRDTSSPAIDWWTEWKNAIQVIGSLIGKTVTGTDQTGADLNLAGGRSTGAGTPGNIVLRTSQVGASGSGANDLQTAATLSGADRSLNVVGGYKANGEVRVDAQGYAVMKTASAADIADKGHAINTTGKAAGRTVFDTTNGRVMVATGATDVSTWKSADGGTTVTPA